MYKQFKWCISDRRSVSDRLKARGYPCAKGYNSSASQWLSREQVRLCSGHPKVHFGTIVEGSCGGGGGGGGWCTVGPPGSLTMCVCVCVCWLGERGQRVEMRQVRTPFPLPPMILVIHLQPSPFLLSCSLPTSRVESDGGRRPAHIWKGCYAQTTHNCVLIEWDSTRCHQTSNLWF